MNTTSNRDGRVFTKAGLGQRWWNGLLGMITAGLLAWQPQAWTTAARAESDQAEPADEATEFIRFVEREDGSGALQTANARLVREEDGVTVDLLSVVHIADADYYQQFNEVFPDYDSVLFELVGDPEALLRASARARAGEAEPREEPEGGRRAAGSMLGNLQASAGRALELVFQLEAVDYSGDNLVHADMDGGQFRQRQRDRNEGFLQLYLRAVRISMANPQAATTSFGLLDLAEAFVAQDRANRLKWLMAAEFRGADGFMQALEADGGTVIIGERNQVAMEVLAERIEEGDRKIAIFYGAGHMGDFEQRLHAIGFETEAFEWWTAWELVARAEIDPAASPPAGTEEAPAAGAAEDAEAGSEG